MPVVFRNRKICHTSVRAKRSLLLEVLDSMAVSHLCFLFPFQLLYSKLPGLVCNSNCCSWILGWGTIHLYYIIWKNYFILCN